MWAIIFMTGWGIFWGGLLGALAGTLIFPIFGTMYSVAWGLGLGAALGIATGIFLALLKYDALPEPQHQVQRRRLALLSGIITAIGAPALLIATTKGFLWGDYAGSSMYIYLIPSLFAACLYGGLAAAATASRFADGQTGDLDALDEFGSVLTTFRHFAARAANKWVFLLAALGTSSVAILGALNARGYTDNPYNPALYHTASDYLRIGVEYGIAGFVGAAVDILLLSLAIGALIGFLNRVYFAEYKAHWTMERYRVVVMLLVGSFTLVAGVVVTMLAGAPFVALYAAYLARGYAERYYEMQGKPKRKGKPKDAGDIELAQDMA